MLDIGWSEMIVIVVVAIIVIGPRDLPGVLRSVGRWVGKARSLSREFQRNLNDIARETEFDEVKRSIRDTTNLGLSGDKPRPVATAPVGGGSDTSTKPAEAKPAVSVDPAPAPAAGPAADAIVETGVEVGPAPADSAVAPAQPAARTEG